MAERKSVNKYIPPNFDPDAVSDRASFLGPSIKQLVRPQGAGTTGLVGSRKPQRTVRLMLPFTLRCNTCGEYIHKGRKFNARKETVWGEDYLGVRIYRFYIRCTQCAAEITFKTDPKNADYACEHGATRNFEPWKKEARETESARIKREMEESMDPMKKLENRTIDSKKEISIAEALDEIKTIKSRIELVDKDALLRQLEAEARLEKTHQQSDFIGDEELLTVMIPQASIDDHGKEGDEQPVMPTFQIAIPPPDAVNGKRPSRIAELQASLGIIKKRSRSLLQ